MSDNNYYAKCTQPVNNPWRTEWLTLDKAKAKADWFVNAWLENGLQTEACVFYRDGNISYTAKGCTNENEA